MNVHKCTRCHRVLRSADSIARQMGRTCARKHRQETAAKLILATYTPVQVEKVRELLADGGVARVTRHLFLAVASNGVDRYEVASALSPPSSTPTLSPSTPRADLLPPQRVGAAGSRPSEGTPKSFPRKILRLETPLMLITNTDLPVLTVAELNRAYEDLIALLADYDGVYGDRLHARLAAMMDELHGRAIAEDIERGIAHLDDEALGLSLEFALLLDVSVPRTAIAIRVLRDWLHERALAEWSVQTATDAEPEECEHGLSAWLCAGPGHYPF